MATIRARLNNVGCKVGIFFFLALGLGYLGSFGFSRNSLIGTIVGIMGSLSFAAGGMFGFRYLRCPKCYKRIGNILNKIKSCPSCGVDLDSEISTIAKK